MNNIVENDFFALFKVVRPHYKVRWANLLLNFLSSLFHAPKIIKIGWFLTSHRCHNQRLLLFKKPTFVQLQIRSLSFRHFGIHRVNATRNNRLVGSYVLNKRAKFDTKIFTCFWEISVFVLGLFLFWRTLYCLIDTVILIHPNCGRNHGSHKQRRH